jgi:iron-sulfur cluster assembly accessory protein
METNQVLQLNVSPNAIEELQRLSLENPEIGALVRIGVKGGGCSGMTYILDYQKASDTDLILDFDGLKIAVDPAHAIYLHGVSLDFAEGLNNRGFTFTNPNATETCGCGTSFAV